jgi:hypothetical protein
VQHENDEQSDLLKSCYIPTKAPNYADTDARKVFRNCFEKVMLSRVSSRHSLGRLMRCKEWIVK